MANRTETITVRAVETWVDVVVEWPWKRHSPNYGRF